MTTTADSSQTDPPTDRAQRVQRYTAALADSIELKWQAWWDEQGTFAVPNPGDAGFDASKPKFFCLDMFPYPSGAGLHVGHPEGYTATDIISRYKRHNGFNVLHPMGWDAFGLPAEQYAIQTGVHPAITTRNAIDNFRRQLKRFGFSYDWSREFATIDEDYYRWTQWIWLKAYNAWYDVVEDRGRPIDELAGLLEAGDRTVGEEGEILAAGAGHAWADLDADARRATIDGQRLAYLGEQVVNWCPKLGTVLANEEVIDGRSERGSHPVLRRPLKQWIFRITAYADRLLADLDPLAWPTSTKKLQADWIGRSEGAEIDFPVEHGEESIRVFTTRPDTIFGATYMVLAPEHPLVDAILASPGPVTDVAALREYVETARNRADVERMEAKEKTGVDTGVKAINPANGAVIPIWVADYVLMGYGHGAIMAVPAHDQRDLDFAEAFELPVVDVVEHAKLVRAPGVAMPEPGVAVNSSHGDLDINGMQKEEAIGTVIAWLERNGRGRARVNFKLRDWLFSRQRYWGEPFPIVYDEAGNHFPVDASALPVVLPDLEDYTPAESDDPQPLLAKATEWMNTTAGAAGVSPEVLPSDTPVRRESNTMPGWAGSCWYYLRYCDPACDDTLIGAAAERYWMRSTKDGSPVGDGAWDP
ncbi:MAG: class I tRNA ligase family protein, partial [Planctomycetota bacterium]